MTDSSNIWSVDRLAANNLLAALKVDESPETLEKVAGHFARHRQSAQEWAAEKAQSIAINKLETVSRNSFGRRSEEWADGFRAAEAQIFAIRREDLLEIPAARSRSTGQILRSLVSEAKRTEAQRDR